MKSQHFALILSGISEITPELANALYEITNGDIELEMREGSAVLEFNRAAPTLQEAVTSAIRDVEGANLGLSVVRVEAEMAHALTTINATLLAVSEERAKQ